MPNLSQKDLFCIAKLLEEEKRIAQKYSDYARLTDDAVIRTICEKGAARHKNYYENIFSFLG